MNRMALVLAAAALGTLAPATAAPDVGRDAGKAPQIVARTVELAEVKAGDRVRVRLSNGHVFSGTIKKIEDHVLYVNLWGEPGQIPAVIGIPETDVAEVARLERLDPDTKLRNEAAVGRRIDANQGMPSPPKPLKTETGLAGRRPGDLAAKVARWRALLVEFPPSEGWGPKAVHAAWMRYYGNDLMPSARERRFFQVFRDWNTARMEMARLRGEWKKLLETYPPGKGWSEERRTEIEAKKKAGERLSKAEAGFLEDFEMWKLGVEDAGAMRSARPGAAPAAGRPVPPYGENRPPAPPSPEG
jgi:hypothetical protein